jgi:hypothetical protein
MSQRRRAYEITFLDSVGTRRWNTVARGFDNLDEAEAMLLAVEDATGAFSE